MDDSKKSVDWIQQGKFEKVCLQFPDDLKTNSVQSALELKKSANSQFYLIDEPSCGTCCTNKHISSYVKADACIHYGHSCLSKNNFPTHNIFINDTLNIELFIENFKKYFNNKSANIVFFYDVSFKHIIDKVSEELKKNYDNLIISELSNDTLIDDTNHTVLGRKYQLSIEQINTFEGVFLGKNEKILMILSMSIPFKQWHCFDGSKFYDYSISKSFWFKKRSYLHEKIRDGHTFGLVIATLNISSYMNIVKYLKSVLKKMKKKVYLLCTEKVEPTKLANFQEIDIFVVIACPENSIYDSKEFFKPVVTPFDIELAFNESRECNTVHAIDFKQFLPGGIYYIDFEKNSKFDVSLLSGKVRNENTVEENIESNSLVQKSFGELQDNQTSAIFLQSRMWKGLELKLGESNVAPIEDGRSGIPINYANEL